MAFISWSEEKELILLKGLSDGWSKLFGVQSSTQTEEDRKIAWDNLVKYCQQKIDARLDKDKVRKKYLDLKNIVKKAFQEDPKDNMTFKKSSHQKMYQIILERQPTWLHGIAGGVDTGSVGHSVTKARNPKIKPIKPKAKKKPLSREKYLRKKLDPLAQEEHKLALELAKSEKELNEIRMRREKAKAEYMEYMKGYDFSDLGSHMFLKPPHLWQ